MDTKFLQLNSRASDNKVSDQLQTNNYLEELEINYFRLTSNPKPVSDMNKYQKIITSIIIKPELIHTNSKKISLATKNKKSVVNQPDAKPTPCLQQALQPLVLSDTVKSQCQYRLKAMASKPQSTKLEETSEFQKIKNKIEQQLILNKIPNTKKPALLAKPFISKIPLSNFKRKTPSSPSENHDLKKSSKDSLGGSLLNTDHSSNQSLVSMTSSNSSLNNNNKVFNHILKSTESVAAKQKPAIAPKPKLIDLEFKNELERLFASGNTALPANKSKMFQQSNTQAKSDQNKLLISTVERNMNSDKLRHLFSLITGNLISDYSELLVDFKTENTSDISPNNSMLALCPQSLLLQNTNALTTEDNDKLVQFLIQILVKSCRVFDVATTVVNDKLSYWRYANPIIAACRQNDNQGRKKSATSNNSTQTTGFDIENFSDNNTGTSRTEKTTIIDASQKIKKLECDGAWTVRQKQFADSVIDLLSDTMSISSGRISYRLVYPKRVVSDRKNDEDDIYEYTCFSGSVSSDTNSEHDFFIDLYDENELSTTDSTDVPIVQNRREKFNYKSINHPIRKLRKANKSAKNYFRIIETKVPARKYFHKIYRDYNDQYKKRIFSRSFFMHSNSKSHRAQDETLRDAENLSDIDDDDIDQWADLNNNNNNNKNINNEGQPEAMRFLKDNHIHHNHNHHHHHHHKNQFKFDTQIEKINLGKVYNKSHFLLFSRNSSNNTTHNKSISKANKKMNQTRKNANRTKINSRIRQDSLQSQRRVKKFLANPSILYQYLRQNRQAKTSSELETATTTTTTTTSTSTSFRGKKYLERCQDRYRISKAYYQDRRKTREDKISSSNFSNLISTTNNSSFKNYRYKSLYKNKNIVVQPSIIKANNFNKINIFRSETKKNLTNLKKLVNLRHNIRFPINIVASLTNMNQKSSANPEQSSYSSSNVERTNSIDSLEDQEVINDINLDSMSEIRIQFEYSMNTGTAAAPSKTETAVYNKADLKPNLKFDQDVIKQRTREGLKFWQKEEEKNKNVEGSSSTSNSSVTNNKAKPVTNKTTTKTSTTSSIPTSYFPMQRLNNTIQSNNPEQADTDASMTNKTASCRVKDRINVFETKVNEGITNNTATSLGLRKPSYLARPVISTNKFPLIELKETTEIITTMTTTQTSDVVNKQACMKTLNFESIGPKFSNRPFDTKLGQSKSVGSEINSVTRIPIHCTKVDQAKSIMNLVKPKTVAQEYVIPVNETYMDRNSSDEALNMVSDIQSVNEVLLDNPSQTSINDDQNQNQNGIEAADEKILVKSQINLLNDERPNLSGSSSSLEMDEMEIIIDLDAYNECRKIDQIDERLKNIVMHMIPTTRKAYVDDICDGIKSLLTNSDLMEIRSPIDLPNQVIKFVQKRYSSLLNEFELDGSGLNSLSSKEQEEQSARNAFEEQNTVHDYPCDEKELIQDLENGQESKTENPNQEFVVNTRLDLETALEIETSPVSQQNTTTELTMVKEFQLNTPNQDGDESYMKVEEDTLYIVEKKLTSPNIYKIVPLSSNSRILEQLNQPEIASVSSTSLQQQQNYHTDSTSTDVEKEIRKSFELKPKIDQFYQTNVASVLNALRLSSANIQAPDYNSPQQNDHQLHFFNISTSENKLPCLILFTDSTSDRNNKFSLEKKYHKSIVETHAFNEKKEINVVASLNVLFTGPAKEFDSFSLINPPKTKQDIHSISFHKIFNNFPIGKYFARIKYISAEACLSKELLIDVSLLPLQIRSNLVYAFETSQIDQSYPSLYLMTLDISFPQTERDILTNNLFRSRLQQFDDVPANFKNAFLANPMGFLHKMKSESSENTSLNQFIKQVDTDLNSFYLCERVIDTPETFKTATDLCKINRLDALAYFNSVQKYSDLFSSVFVATGADALPVLNLNTQTRVKETKLDDQIFQTHGNRFFIIENDKWFKCLVPITDLPANQESRLHQTNDQLVKSVENLQHNSSLIIENANKRQNFIFSRHLMNVPPFKNFGSMANLIMNLHEHIKCIELQKEREDESTEIADIRLPEADTESDFSHHLHRVKNGSRSELSSSHIYNSVQTYDIPNDDTNQKCEYSDLNDQVAKFQQETLNRNVKGVYSQEIRNLSEVEFASFETDRLKKGKSSADLNANSQEVVKGDVVVRDQIIIKEIDKMFTSIRDHQGSNAKAKGELKYFPKTKKRSGSWGYSSNKRHVKAKVMDMPYAEDYETIMKRIEMGDTTENTGYSQTAVDEASEKVFVRIDDYLNIEVSKALERSYSVDYLNQDAGQRTRIRYIRIPGHMIETDSRKVTENQSSCVEQQVTEYRSAPYDLRYWSILKLLEEEQQNGGKTDGSVMELRKIENPQDEFLSMNELEEEIKKVNNTNKVAPQVQEYLVNDPTPKYIIKEKTVKKSALKKIDAELERIEKEKEILKNKIGKNKSFKSGFKIIDRLFGQKERKNSSQASSSSESIGGNLKKSSSSTACSDGGNQIVKHAYSAQQIQYSGLDVLDGAYKQHHQEKRHGSGKMTIVDRLTNLLPSSHLGHDRQSRKNY